MSTRTLERVSLQYFDLEPHVRLEPGDEFNIQGEMGSFTFIAHVVTPKGEWIDAFGGLGNRRQFRSFTPTRITKKLYD